MKTETLAIGALALLGVGVGAYALAKKQGGASGGQKAAGQSLPASPQVDPSTNPAGISGPSTTDAIKAVQDRAKAEAEERARLEAIQAELARQEAARQAEARRAEIARLTNAAAAVENDQILVLSRIKAITNDNSRLEDFTRQYVNEQVSGGRFEGLRLACWKQSEANCGGRGFLGMGRCWSDNGQGCDPQQTITNGYFKGAWNGNTDLNPWGLIAKEASDPANPNGGPARLARWKEEQRTPLEAELARLEVQYQGIVRELRERFGVEFQSKKPEAHTYKTEISR